MTLDELAGDDLVMTRAAQLCRRTANKDLPLLIQGETGVGKDVLARALHADSRRAGKPFVAINCAAIPETLLASELLGYAPGTFTGGAKNGYAGKLAASNGGTFFLDEIGDMPLGLQAHLLRVLDQKSVTPLGCNKAIPLDIRFVSATHCDLRDLVARGRFRQDLFYRVSGVQVTLPALRNRTDLPDLVSRLLRDEALRLEQTATLSHEVTKVFRRYDWPGNIRELRSALRLALCTCEGSEVRIAHLPPQIIEFARNLGYSAA